MQCSEASFYCVQRSMARIGGNWLLGLWVVLLSLPFFGALMLACCVDGEQGNYQLVAPYLAGPKNLGRALSASSSPTLRDCFAISLVVSVSSSLLTVAFALPLSRLLATKWKLSWNRLS